MLLAAFVLTLTRLVAAEDAPPPSGASLFQHILVEPGQ